VSEVLERRPRAISARSTTAAPDRLRHLKATDL
jgi:hypothetical protein